MRRTLAAGSAVLIGVVSAAASPYESHSAQLASTRCSVPLVLHEPPANRPSYVLHVRIGRGLTSVSGTLAVSFRPDVATNRLVFRLWPNSPAYARRGGRLTVGRVTVGGATVPTSRPDATTLVVDRPLRARERVTVSLPWKLQLPRGSGLQLKGGRSSRLVSFFPLLAWDGKGWATDPALHHFDSIWSTSPTADFDVHVVNPPGLRVLATGSPVGAGRWRARREGLRACGR